MGTLKALADALIKAYHESPRFMAVMCIICAALLFMPSRILAPLSIASLVTNYRPYIGLGFLFSLGMTVSYPIQAGSSWVAKTVRASLALRRGKARLHRLDNMEKAILHPFISQNNRTQYFDYNNGTVAHLQLFGILLCPRKIVRTDKVPMVLADWAWDHLHKHPELLK